MRICENINQRNQRNLRETFPVRYFTPRQWRQLIAKRGEGRSLTVYLASPTDGHCDIDFSYANKTASGKILARKRQRITAVNPPLLPDYNRDGSIDGADISLFLDGSIFRYWTNQDTDKGDRVGESSSNRPNMETDPALARIGSQANYHQNASNAFEVAAQLAGTISNIPGEKVIMAHSLGNMVVSSMIQDHGLQVSKYFMCNSAVPSEAYCQPNDISIRVSQLVYPDWESYPTNSWVSNWHKLFVNEQNDDRKFLGWPGRFANVARVAVNFYSTGDEVLELYGQNNIL